MKTGTIKIGHNFIDVNMRTLKLGPVTQANGRLTYEDDLRSGGLL